MKKMILLFTILGVLLSATTAFAATVPVTKKELVKQIAEQQAIYNQYVGLSVSYITTINQGKLSFDELVVYQAKRDECRKVYNAAAEKMSGLKKQLFNLENNIK